MKDNDLHLRTEQALPTNSDTGTVNELTSLSIKSPSLAKRVLEHKIDLENKEENHIWKSCCFKSTDSRLLTFVASFTISLSLLFFSCFQLARDDIDCNSENLYVGLITLILGVWVKSPIQN